MVDFLLTFSVPLWFVYLSQRAPKHLNTKPIENSRDVKLSNGVKGAQSWIFSAARCIFALNLL